MSFKRLFSLSVALLSLSACGGIRYQLEAPAGFSAYQQAGDQLRLVSPEGVKLLVRSRPNEPKAPLSFWGDAISEHLQRNGYLERARVPLEAREARAAGQLISLTRAHSGEDWGYLIAVFVDDERLILVEMSGPLSRTEAARESLIDVLNRFTWRE